jgi:acetaldehyde dehydrogenase (acetylating)
VPSVNLAAQIALGASNLNMVTCGGQATIPMVYAVSRVQPVDYGEIIATVSSRSAGPGTRANIDEFTRTTATGVERVGGAKRGKAIIIINPADPPIIMRDTIHCLTETDPDQEAIRASVHAMVADVQKYVPGYQLKNGPVFDGPGITDRLEVARTLGATGVVTSRDTDEIREQVMEMTNGEGAHVVIDSISGKSSMAAAHATVRAGGAIGCLGMDHFMQNVPEINWFDQFLRNITITGGLVPGPKYFPELLDAVKAGRLDPAPVLTTELSLDDAADGYRKMQSREEGVIKVCLTAA